MMLSSVDLPQPDAPTRHTSSPARTFRSMPSSAVTGSCLRRAGKRLTRPSTSSFSGRTTVMLMGSTTGATRRRSQRSDRSLITPSAPKMSRIANISST